jgi:hypothetical protein
MLQFHEEMLKQDHAHGEVLLFRWWS